MKLSIAEKRIRPDKIIRQAFVAHLEAQEIVETVKRALHLAEREERLQAVQRLEFEDLRRNFYERHST